MIHGIRGGVKGRKRKRSTNMDKIGVNIEANRNETRKTIRKVTKKGKNSMKGSTIRG